MCKNTLCASECITVLHESAAANTFENTLECSVLFIIYIFKRPDFYQGTNLKPPFNSRYYYI